ncbi:Transcriptional regulator, GntR family [Roseomonas mucosa]|uniref:GntR family transcriptional regulator n=1 Tax=Roseomonas mucosa TaxID=207340 RepID=UPI0022061366|nr:GntR family transcriptional regulator [Roseomonas mucosa]QDJ08468.1 Transcriptional regulator, GntR family [Roseomonas mucosa]
MPPAAPIPLEIETTPGLAERAYVRLRDAIVEGSLAAGSKLSERRLAAALGISAQPVREALRRLEGEGLVETRPKSGTFVSALDSDRLAEMGRIRAALEGAAASLAARRVGPADLRVLEQRLGAIRAATDQGDRAALAGANDAFHTALHRITGNAFLIRSLQALRAYFHVGSRRVLAGEAEIRLALEEHLAILDAIAAGEAEQAERLMRAHALRSLAVAFPEADRCPPAPRPASPDEKDSHES